MNATDIHQKRRRNKFLALSLVNLRRVKIMGTVPLLPLIVTTIIITYFNFAYKT